MGKEAGNGCKRFHGGQALKKLFVLVAIIGLVYGALFRISERRWPWQDWGAFFTFSKTSTQNAFEKGKEFTREKVFPKTKQLLARAHDLLEKWDTEDPLPAEEPAEGEVAQGPEDEALEVTNPSDREPAEGETDVAASEEGRQPREAPTGAEGETAAEVVAHKPSPAKTQASTEAWRKGRASFKEGLKHYQRSSPEMEGSQDELRAARDDFRKSLEYLEEAKRADPDNHLIENDLQEVQTFLVDCQRRLTLEPKTY